MKIIEANGMYQIYEDGLQTFDKLPAQVYSVEFMKNQGFFLDKHSDTFEVKEDRIYGSHMIKVQKVLNSFEIIKQQRNLGVILSGAKGIGKSLFAKLLAIEAIKKDVPVIIVDRYIPGIADFLASIDQEVLVMFDEYDKTFGGVNPQDGAPDPQTELLTLFDGLYQGRKIFVITCNSINKLNSYLVNRPGRFHYHFRFDYPNADEVTEYLQDKIPEEKYSEITKVIAFSKKVPLNYDCLRSIAFELRHTGDFEEAIKDLNIINVDKQRYKVVVHFSNGMTDFSNDYMDMFDSSTVYSEYFDSGENGNCHIKFAIADCVFNPKTGSNIVTGDHVKCDFFDDEDNKDEKKDSIKVDYVEIIRYRERDIHYTV